MTLSALAQKQEGFLEASQVVPSSAVTPPMTTNDWFEIREEHSWAVLNPDLR